MSEQSTFWNMDARSNASAGWQEVVDGIMEKYPTAICLLDYLNKYKGIPEGLLIVNHPYIDPFPITTLMLQYNFPSYRDATFFYVVDPVPPEEFISSAQREDC